MFADPLAPLVSVATAQVVVATETRDLTLHYDVSDQLGLSTASGVLEALLMTAAQSSFTFRLPVNRPSLFAAGIRPTG